MTKYKFKCEYCDKKATTKDSLKRHTNALHLGVKLKCKQCQFQAYLSGLKEHINSVHEGVSYLFLLHI